MRTTGKIGLLTAGTMMLAGLAAGGPAANADTAPAPRAMQAKSGGWEAVDKYVNHKGGHRDMQAILRETKNHRVSAMGVFIADGEKGFLVNGTRYPVACLDLQWGSGRFSFCAKRGKMVNYNTSIPEHRTVVMKLTLENGHGHIYHKTTMSRGKA
ncbi:hypothetical protein J4573_08470 [Actinomadura barringtoniae]|uniref:Uncharacterized protein n=1 Tax=Actinomadura barringtoniae TaxID=1427535 RepID=A0A939P7P3_9ACTN|nr:hypothetical protein [Actinomadura barringtoniae]MBO2447118.1 hypothetical protein [Actinomadura barringtoniae]